ncbi:MAG: hypothetical protein KDC37_07840 [Flavobacteriales bacterium]|nr:hypothetical protein [Flavobacteriales bacterium]
MDKIKAQQRYTRLHWPILFIIGFLITSCQPAANTPDIADIPLTLRIARFDSALFAPGDMQLKVESMRAQYPDFFEIYTDKIINAGAGSDPTVHIALTRFTTDADMSAVWSEIQKTHGDLSAHNSKLENAFKRYSYYFPNKPIPQVLAMHSAFNYAVAVTSEVLAIGLDMYLGTDYSYYTALQFPLFRRRTMHPEHIATDAMRTWVATEFENDSLRSDLPGHLLAEGRLMYAMELLMPGLADTIITGFGTDQLKWCRENEKQMWAFLIEKKLLFSSHSGNYRKLLSEGPFTPGFDRRSPAKAVTWLGYNMVKSYMQKNTDVTLTQLMTLNNGREFLQKTGYKPI